VGIEIQAVSNGELGDPEMLTYETPAYMGQGRFMTSAVDDCKEAPIVYTIRVSKEGYEPIVRHYSGTEIRQVMHWVLAPSGSELSASEGLPLAGARPTHGDPTASQIGEIPAGRADSFAAPSGSGPNSPQPEREAYYLPPSLKDSGTSCGILSFSDDILFMNLREKAYLSEGEAKSAATKDAIIGSLGASATVYAIGLALTGEDDRDKVALGALAYIPISYLYHRAQLTSGTKHTNEVYFEGEWVDPATRRLEKRGDRWFNPDRERWDFARERDTPESYREYLALEPLGSFRSNATARLETLEATEWMRAEAEESQEVYASYLHYFPDGAHAASAEQAYDQLWWERSRTQGTVAAFDSYLRERPAGAHAGEAWSLREVPLWRNVEALGRLRDYSMYLRQYPNGRFSQQAEATIFSELHGMTWEIDRVKVGMGSGGNFPTGRSSEDIKDALYGLFQSALTVSGYNVVEGEGEGRVEITYGEYLTERSWVNFGENVLDVGTIANQPASSVRVEFIVPGEGVMKSQYFEELEIIEYWDEKTVGVVIGAVK